MCNDDVYGLLTHDDSYTYDFAIAGMESVNLLFTKWTARCISSRILLT